MKNSIVASVALLLLLVTATALLFKKRTFIDRGNSMKSKIVNVDDLAIYTESFGDSSNPASLLIAGAAAPAEFWTNEFCQRLADSGYYVIRYDHPDTGKSTLIDWQKNPYALKDLNEYALAALDAYNVKRAHMIGHSMGGFMTQWLAVENPERVLSVTSISAGPIGATPETDQPLTDEEKKNWEKTWQVFLSRIPADTYKESVDGSLKVWNYLNGSVSFDEQMAKDYTRALFKGDVPQGMSRNHEKIMQQVYTTLHERRAWLKKITVPTLIIHGKEDPLVLPHRGGIAVKNQIPQAQLILISGMGHMLFNKKLEQQVLNGVTKFLNKTTQNNIK